MDSDALHTTDRRGFVGRLSALAAMFGLGRAGTALAAPLPAGDRVSASPEFEAWLDSITGRHKQVFDAANVNDGTAGRFAQTWMNTMRDTYQLADSDLSCVIVARHAGVVLALGDAIWEKYKFGERYKITDPATQQPAIRNPWGTARPGGASDGVTFDKLLARGAKVAACGVALAGRSASSAEAFKMDKEQVKAEWLAGLLPGVVVAPSGVLAVHRAQEKGCSYCYGG